MGELGINSSAHTEYITFKPTEQTCSRACLFILFLVVVGFGDFFFPQIKSACGNAVLYIKLWFYRSV